jgi:arylamine N-acetyltransferase
MTTPAYTQAQIEQYLTYISFPTDQKPLLEPSQTRTSAGLDYLSILQKHQLCTTPFENVSLHYSQTKLLSLDPDDLFQKIVVNKRGGYCMEVNHFFGCMLKSMGFDVVSTGGRVYMDEENMSGL